MENGDSLYLEYLLKDDELGKSLNEAQIRECFNYDYYTKNVDRYLRECLGKIEE